MMKSMTTQSDLEKVKLVHEEMDETVKIINENVEKTKSLWRGEKFTPSNDIDKADESDRVVEEFKRFLAGSKPSPDQLRLRPKVELDLKNIFKKKPIPSISLAVSKKYDVANREIIFSFEAMNKFFD